MSACGTSWQPHLSLREPSAASVGCQPTRHLPTLNTEHAREVFRSLEAIEEYASAIANREAGGREARHDLANALQLCELLDLEARSRQRADDLLSRVDALRDHLRALAGTGEPNPHSRHQHHAWALEAVASLRTPLTRQSDLLQNADGNQPAPRDGAPS